MLIARISLLKSPTWGTAYCPSHLLDFYAWRGRWRSILPSPIAKNWSLPLSAPLAENALPPGHSGGPRAPVYSPPPTLDRRPPFCALDPLFSSLRTAAVPTGEHIALVLAVRKMGCCVWAHCCIAVTSFGRYRRPRDIAAKKHGASSPCGIRASTGL